MGENIDPDRLSALSYASRKAPEFMNLNLVLCPTCDLVYADHPPARDELASAYHDAEFDSSAEAEQAADSYLRAISPLLALLPTNTAALEIGTGTGAFLSRLESAGFGTLVGIEPSSAAIEAAPKDRRAWIRLGIFEEVELERQSFDLVCCFMTMEHVLDPRVMAESVLELLRPCGAFVTVTHDYRALVNRALGRRSPIIDIEHMQLFSKKSIDQLFSRAGYRNINVRSFRNSYALDYWWRLLPLPGRLKNGGGSVLRASRLGRIRATVNVGNLVCWGQRPA